MKVIDISEIDDLEIDDIYVDKSLIPTNDTYVGPDSQDRILISHTPLSYNLAEAVIAQLVYEDGVFNRTLNTLRGLDMLLVTNDLLYASVVDEFMNHIQRVNRSWSENTIEIPRPDNITLNTALELMMTILKTVRHHPTSTQKIQIGRDIIEILFRSPYNPFSLGSDIAKCLESAELYPLVFDYLTINVTSGREKANVAAINRFATDEIRQILNDDVTDQRFVISTDALVKLDLMTNAETSIKNANQYLGFDCQMLDLSASYLTGDLVAAACGWIKNKGEKLTIDTVYPTKYTELNPDDYQRWRDAWEKLWKQVKYSYDIPYALENVNLQVNGHHVQIDVNDETFNLTINSGASIEIMVDYDADLNIVANQHYDVIREHYPKAKLVKMDNMYQIHNAHRLINIYHSDINDILLSPMPMHRGWMTYNEVTDANEFTMSADCCCSLIDHRINDYYYFSADQQPLEQFALWKQRGYELALWRITSGKRYSQDENRWLRQFIIDADNNYQHNEPRWKTWNKYALRENLDDIRIGYGHFDAIAAINYHKRFEHLHYPMEVVEYLRQHWGAYPDWYNTETKQIKPH